MEGWLTTESPACSYHGGMHHFPRNKNSPTVLTFVADKYTSGNNIYVREMNSENVARIVVLGVIPQILYPSVA